MNDWISVGDTATLGIDDSNKTTDIIFISNDKELLKITKDGCIKIGKDCENIDVDALVLLESLSFYLKDNIKRKEEGAYIRGYETCRFQSKWKLFLRLIGWIK